MKKITLSALILACGLTAFQACQVEEINNGFNAGKATVFHINALPSETKSVFGEAADGAYPTLWTATKQVSFSRDEGALAYGTPTLVNGGAGATFDVELEGEATEGTIYAFSPKGVYDKENPGNNVPGFTSLNTKYHDAYLNIPSAQTPLANSVDESAQAIVGSVAYTDGEYDLDMSFSHVVAYGKMTIANFAGSDIASVSIKFPAPVAGSSCYYYYAAEEGDEEGQAKIGSIANMNVDTIVLNPANVEDNVFWFAVAPVEGNTGLMKIAVTDVTGATYTKALDLAAKALPFVKGEVSSFTVSFRGIEEDQPAGPVVADGDYVILAKDGDDYYAVSANANGTSSRRDRTSVTYDGEESFETSKEELIWSITAVEGGFTIANGDYFMSAGKNIIPLVDADAAATVTITDNGNGNYELTADCGSDGTRYMALNGTNGFGWYASVTGSHVIYLVPATYVAPTLYDITVSPTTNGSVTVSKPEAEEGETISVTVTPDDGYELASLTYNGNDIKSDKSFTMPAEAVIVEAAFSLKDDGGTADEPSSLTISSDDVVTNSLYAKYEATVDDYDWLISFGGNNKSVGTNSGNRSKCVLGSDYAKYAVSPVSTSDIASVFAGKTKLSGVKKISYTVGGGSNQTNTNVYVLYSADGNTFSQISLTSGTQGAALSSGTEYSFTACDGYFAVLFVATNTSGNWRIDDVNLTFEFDAK